MPDRPDTLLPDFSIPMFRDSNPLQIFKPALEGPVTIQQFTDLVAWRQYVTSLRLRDTVPAFIRRKHDQVLQLLFMAWLDAAVIKLAELGALATLESTIKVHFPDQEFNGLESALKHLVDSTGLTDKDLRVSRETGLPVVINILRKPPPDNSSLSEIRNRLAHGDPFEIMPWAGLFEVVRDLIDFMYPATS